jgi:hypothetical protein
LSCSLRIPWNFRFRTATGLTTLILTDRLLVCWPRPLTSSLIYHLSLAPSVYHSLFHLNLLRSKPSQ